MAMPQRDNYIEELNRLEGLLECAVQHNDLPEVKRISKEMEKILEQRSEEHTSELQSRP